MGRVETIIVMLAIPTFFYVVGGLILNNASGREPALKQLQAANQMPLGRKLFYGKADFQDYWNALKDPTARGAEQRFLKLDLFFPFVYCGALAASLLIGRSALGWPSSPVWLLAPVVATMLADWTENLLQLGQIKRLLAREALQEPWIWAASAATTLKWLFLAGTSVLLLRLVWLLLRKPA